MTARSRLYLCLLAALVIRLLALWVGQDAQPLFDEKLYLHRAQMLLDGEGFVGSFQSWVRHPGEPIFDTPQYHGAYQPPGYTLFIAAVMGVTGHSILAVKLAQVLLSTLSVFLVYRLARSSASERAALIASWGAALYPNLIFFSHVFWSETLYIVLLLGMLNLLVPSLPNMKQAIALGLLAGFASLTRGATVTLLPLLLAWMILVRRDQWRCALASSAVVLGATALVILPWTLRNWKVHEGFVLIETNSSYNLWRGNNPKTFLNRPIPPYEPPFESLPLFPVGESTGALLVEEVQETLGVDQPTDLQIVQYAKEQAIAFIRADAGRFFYHGWLKLIDTFNPTSFLVRHLHPRFERYGEVPESAQKLLIGSAIFSYLLVAATGLIGLLLCFRQPLAGLTVLIVFYHGAGCAVVFGLTRFRLPLIPLLLVFAAQCFVRRRS